MKRFALLLLALPALLAHDLEVSATIAPPAVVMRCAYGGSEPAAYAAVLVYAPGEAKTEYQNGRTDASGVFSFVPGRPGEWRFIVDDEIGHRRELKVNYTLAGPASAASGAAPLWQRLGSGVAILFGLTGILYGWKSRRG